MGIVLDMLSGKRFPLLVESTIIEPPFCATQLKKTIKNRIFEINYIEEKKKNVVE
jgi:hypothetical protein